MAKFEGMFNGRPQGKGVLFWDDGEEVGRLLLHCFTRFPVSFQLQGVCTMSCAPATANNIN